MIGGGTGVLGIGVFGTGVHRVVLAGTVLLTNTPPTLLWVEAAVVTTTFIDGTCGAVCVAVTGPIETTCAVHCRVKGVVTVNS